MGIHQNSPLIDAAEVRKLHALTGDALAAKQANDEALAKIIKGGGQTSPLGYRAMFI